MKSGQYKNIKYTGALLLALLGLCGTGCEILAALCNNGPAGAVRTLAGTDAAITSLLGDSGDNNSYRLTIATPDPYLRWKTDDLSESGSHTVTCFMDCWQAYYGGTELPAVVWIGSAEPLRAFISSLQYADGVITGELRRLEGDPNLAGSGDIAIAINQSYIPYPDACQGKIDLNKNCFQPFFSPEGITEYSNAVGASLNFAAFDGADLSGSDFNGASLGYASFAGADLRDVDFNGAVLVYTDFTGADMADVNMGSARVYKVIAPNGTEVNSVTSLLQNRSLSGGPSTTTTIDFLPLRARN